jgi:hypothetical protein
MAGGKPKNRGRVDVLRFVTGSPQIGWIERMTE